MSKKIGVDIGGTTIKLAVLDEKGQILKKGCIPTPYSDLHAMTQEIGKWIGSHVPDYRELPIGIACAGSIHPDTQLLSADNLGLRNVPLQKQIEEVLRCSVAVSQDAHAAMIAEWKYGSLQGANYAVYLILGTGVGGDALIDGKPYRLVKHSAMEFGHMITHPNGEPCPCGERGCYERYASASALVRRVPGAKSAREIIDNVQRGNPEVLTIWETYVEEICIGILNLCRIFQPEKLAIGGGISQVGSFLLNSILKELEKHPFWNSCHTELVLGSLGNDAGVIGAAAIAEAKDSLC